MSARRSGAFNPYGRNPGAPDDRAPLPGLQTLEPRLLLSGTISAAFVAVDNSAALAGYNTFDLQVTTSADWTGGVLLLTLTQGTIYQDAVGNALAPNPGFFGAFPTLEFDTAVGGDAASPSIAGAAGDLGGDGYQFDTAELDVTWFNVSGTDTGTFAIARITLSDDAVGTWSYMAINSASDSATDSGTITAGSLLPVDPPDPTPAIDGDFDEDGKADIVWRNLSTGQTAIWTMDDTTFQASNTLTGAANDTDWRPVGVGDFTGDGKSDTLWHNIVDGRNYIEATDGGVAGARTDLPTVSDTRWTVAGVADFTGDGNNDILWRHTRNGRNLLWEMNGTAHVQNHAIKRMKNTDWRIGGVGDFDGDDKADILWRNTATGRNAVWRMNRTAFLGSTGIQGIRNQAWQIAQVGDFTGDGKADILWRHSGTGANTVWQMNGTAFLGATAIQSQPDQDWQIAGPLLGLWEV